MTDEALLDSLKAIAHPSRLNVLRTLTEGERNVGEIEEATGIGQPTLSQQLAILRKADLVQTRRQAKMVYYSLDEEALARLGAALGDLVPATTRRPADPGARGPAPGVANFARLEI